MAEKNDMLANLQSCGVSGSCSGSGSQKAFVNGNGCAMLLSKISQLEFAILEATLYLDVYPNCNDALNYIRSKNSERNELLKMYEAECGPLSMFGIKDGVNKSPWPWQNCQNQG